jgi:hypothetical protein
VIGKTTWKEKESLTHYGGTEIAENFKNQGNEAYGRGRVGFADAIKFYTQALEVECQDQKLNEACYANRAAVNLELRKLEDIIQVWAITLNEHIG